jgi:hypothetical protein
MILKKKIKGLFIRGPLYLGQFKKFRDLGFGPALLYLHYNYIYQMQKQQQRKTNKWWPVEKDPRYVRLSNIKPFWRRPQQKYEAIKKCEDKKLIEVLPTRKKQAAIIRILEDKEVTDEK